MLGGRRSPSCKHYTQLTAMRTAAAFVSLWGLACQQHVCGFVVNTPALRQRSSQGAAARATSALSMKAGPNPKTWYPHSVSMMPNPDDPPEVDPRRKDPDRPAEAPPVRMPVVDVGGSQMDVISRLLKDRILLLGQQVNDEVANVLVAQLLYLANDDPDKDITLYINSPGGSVSAGMAIYDAMQYVPCDVSTVCFGTAASMGAFLLGAGAKGKRRSLPNARIMIHQPLGGAQGQAADIEIQAKEILFIRSLLNSYMAEYCDQPADKIQDDCDRDFFMTPEEAMDYGLIDEVVTTKTSHIPKPAMPSLEEVF
ncbi:unnamed protein product [Ectocarpus sp. CCAP 1310/34]|nr:unnamed protein product [Ectocarpus sp. CCAP 1310/34]